MAAFVRLLRRARTNRAISTRQRAERAEAKSRSCHTADTKGCLLGDSEVFDHTYGGYRRWPTITAKVTTIENVSIIRLPFTFS